VFISVVGFTSIGFLMGEISCGHSVDPLIINSGNDSSSADSSPSDDSGDGDDAIDGIQPLP
jgi:hypothetical protein